MLSAPCRRFRLRGSHLLEALVAIALFSFGVLGLVGVLAQSIRATHDARLRTEAATLAHAMLAEMWTMRGTAVEAQFTAGGAAFDAWNARIASLLPAAATTVEFPEARLSAQSRAAVVTIAWLLPGAGVRHRYVASAEIGRNP